MEVKTFVIANPNAGNGKVKQEWNQIERLLRAKLPAMDWAFSEGPDHATLLSREAFRDGWDMVVAVGGDGTVNEVINGFYEKPNSEDYTFKDGWIDGPAPSEKTIHKNPILGIIPIGTGGDFRRSVGLMGGIGDSIARLGNQNHKSCDLGKTTYIAHNGKVSSRYYANIASAGLAGDVDKVANNMWKGLGGKASFALASVWAWANWKNFKGEVIIDDVNQIEGNFQNVVVANGGYFGGGMWIAPGAELDSGFLETVLIGDLSRLEAVALMKKVYDGTHFDIKKIKKHRAKKVAVKGGGVSPVLLDLDGEQPGRLPALFQVLESAIRVAY